LDLTSEGSRETDKVGQLEARTQAYGDRARIYHECTVSIETGRIWREITNGTDSRIAIRCSHCRRFVTPEREHLIGWQTAQDELDAGEKGHLVCPECGSPWTEDERVAANHDCILVHKGQEITPEGTITGKPPRTETLGFRWNAANNLLVKQSAIAKKEWKAARAADEDNAAKELLQFWWAKPHKPDSISLTTLDPHFIIKRANQDVPRGRVPAGAGRITIGIDCGKYLLHWTALAWSQHATPHVIEYGRVEVPTAEMGEERAVLTALRMFRDGIHKDGWPADERMRQASLVTVDAGWHQDIVLEFCAESQNFLACKGFGIRQIATGRQAGDKTEAGWMVKWAPSGSGYELLVHPAHTAKLLSVKADYWKTWLHARIATPVGQPGAFSLHGGGDHLGFAKHLTAEKKVEEFIAGKGLVARWDQVNRNNHFLESTCLACVAGHVAGERLMGEAQTAPKQTQNRVPASDWMGGGRRW
jgi:phage terminase large subunit GpA-like protein